jgi:hypothetical protein
VNSPEAILKLACLKESSGFERWKSEGLSIIVTYGQSSYGILRSDPNKEENLTLSALIKAAAASPI